VLSGANASTLLPYLKNASNVSAPIMSQVPKLTSHLKVEEQATSDYLLKIFRTTIPHMPKTATKFGHALQVALQPMILKPSTAGGVTASDDCQFIEMSS
jgi:cohesin loading factor subunit SCC2